jgi:hypothetical protein
MLRAMVWSELNLFWLPLLWSFAHLPYFPGRVLWIPCEVSCYVVWMGHRLSFLCFFSLLPVKICLGFKKMHKNRYTFKSVMKGC